VRVVVDEAGITFCARSRRRFVPWSDLRSVRVAHTEHDGTIRWRFAERPHVVSAAAFGHLHRLLVDVEQHAPTPRVID